MAQVLANRAMKLETNLANKVAEAEAAKQALANAKAAHENTEKARKELENAKTELSSAKKELQSEINSLRSNLTSKVNATNAEKKVLEKQLNALVSNKTKLLESIKSLSEEKETTVASLKAELNKARTGSNADIKRVRKNAANLQANLEKRLTANKNATEQNRIRLEGELNAARKAISKFEAQLKSVKNNQDRANSLRSVQEKKRIKELYNKILQLKEGDVRVSSVISDALISDNKNLIKLAMSRVLDTKSVPLRVYLKDQKNINKQDYIAAHLTKNMNPINMHELLTIIKTNSRIANFKGRKPVVYGANIKRPVSGKPSSGVAPRNTVVRGEPSVEYIPEEQNKSKKPHRYGGTIKATPAAR
jgi:hypothetical protein